MNKELEWHEIITKLQMNPQDYEPKEIEEMMYKLQDEINKAFLIPISNDEVKEIIENAWGVLEIENFTGTSTSGVLNEEAKVDIFDCLSENSKRILSQYISQLESKVSKIEEITDYILVDYTRVDNKYQKLSDVANEIKQILKASDE